MTETLESIKRKLFIYSVTSVLIYAIPIYTALYTPFIESEMQGAWFQRSGSLMVIIGAFIEYKLFSIRAHFNIVGTVWDRSFETPESYNTWYNIISYATLSTIVVGTLIWGYGDIPFENS